MFLRPLIHHPDVICCVAFGRSSLRRMTSYAAVLTLLALCI